MTTLFRNFARTGLIMLTMALAAIAHGQGQTPLRSNGDARSSPMASSRPDDTPTNVLSPDQWRRVDSAVGRALDWLAAQQRPDGSFPTLAIGQPGVTSLCTMAFIAHGHMPGRGRFGKQLERAIDYVASCQKPNGLVTLEGPDGPEISRNVSYEIGTCAAYNHAISSLALSEVYGMTSGQRARRIQAAINRSLAASLEMQRWHKQPADQGGWRYVKVRPAPDSDLSITGWELMFLRSARNAGFDVQKKPIDEAVTYVRRCYSVRFGTFQYLAQQGNHCSRAMAGAGILALAHAGYHNAAEAKSAAEWILRHNFDRYNATVPTTPDETAHERYHYSLLMCCQGMYQLGGRYWEEFFPRTVHTLLANQQPDGSWPADRDSRDHAFGNAYTTALVVIALGAPNQLLPIFQR